MLYVFSFQSHSVIVYDHRKKSYMHFNTSPINAFWMRTVSLWAQLSPFTLLLHEARLERGASEHCPSPAICHHHLPSGQREEPWRHVLSRCDVICLSTRHAPHQPTEEGKNRSPEKRWKEENTKKRRGRHLGQPITWRRRNATRQPFTKAILAPAGRKKIKFSHKSPGSNVTSMSWNGGI